MDKFPIIESQLDSLERYKRKFSELESSSQNKTTTVETLHENKVLFREFYENCPLAVWEEDCSEVKSSIDALSYMSDKAFTEYMSANPRFVLDCINKIKVINVNQTALKLYKIGDKRTLKNHLEKVFNNQSLITFKEFLLSMKRKVTCFKFSTETKDFEGNVLHVTVFCLVPPFYQDDYSKLFVSVADITPLKKIEDALRTSEHRYQKLTTISPVGIFHTNEQGHCMFHNKAAQRIMGLKKNVKEKVSWFDTVFSEDKEFVFALWQMTNAKKIPFKTEVRFIHEDGVICWGIVESIAYRDEKGVIRYIGTVTDITKRRLAEEKLQQHHKEFQRMACVMGVDEMATTLSHEINQPLTSIVHYAGGCMKRLQRLENVPVEIISAMKKIIVQAEHAGAIVHRLKNFLHHGQLQRCSMSLNRVIEEGLQLLGVQLERAQVSFNQSFTENLPNVKVDALHIEQVIVNIVQNALEAMHSLPAAERHLEIQTLLFAPKEVAVIISDSGPGITKENIERVFQPFFTTQVKGMGIGLAISRSIVEAHGGRLLVESPPNCGARFSVILPVEED